ncbi:hypothetical protein [Falsiroseomonas sp.]|uniref:hypothetical protein n=1 Tax=Falsiroseomonas sp. TaxID=2870721 RepID=UPI003F729CC4
MRVALAMVAMLAAGPALGQGLTLPGRGAQGVPGLIAPAETQQQKREFCQRVAAAAGRCAMAGGAAAPALAACLVQGLPAQDSMRVAQLAQSARGSVAGLLSECGVGLGR